MVESNKDPKELLKDDKLFAQDGPFEYTEFINLINTLANNTSKWNPSDLCLVLVNLPRPLKKLSTALGKMGEKIQLRIKSIREVYKLYNEDEGGETIQEVCASEKKKNTFLCNGSNNKKLGYKEGVYKNYESLCCVMNKVERMFNFQQQLYSNIVSTDKGPKDCFKSAFEVTLGKHLGMIKRGVFSTAMSFVTNERKEFYNAVLGSSTIDEAATNKLKEISTSLSAIHEYIKKFIADNGITVEFSD